jgi:hypothetical protein
VLGTLVLLLVVAASAVVAGIVFVLFGPVPINRKVVIVAPIQAMPTAAAPIMMAPIRAPQAPAIPDATAWAPTPSQVAVAAAITPAPIAPPVPAARPRKITPVERGAVNIAAARPPRGETPPPLPRSRAARGTQGRPREIFESVEVTAQAPRRPQQTFDSVEVTARQASSFDADEMTSLDEAQLS